ncbi:MAG: 3-isopropylmalate dehydratase small subunit [Gemmatimonadota bacterium]
MRPFTRVSGSVTPLDRVDVDTDQIIPKQFLKRIERTGYGDFLFYDHRYLEDGVPDPDFILNRPEFQGSPILLSGRNFGCGSSREHAAWALADYGFRTVIAPSFADIFRSNAFQNGLLPVTLAPEHVRHLMDRALESPGYEVTVDLESCRVMGADGFEADFDIDPFRRTCLLEGTDDIDLTLKHQDRIRLFEDEHATAGLLE